MALAKGELRRGLSIEDGQVNDNDRKKQKFIHKEMLSCG